jgi:thioester reductase-like protein
MRSSNKNPRKAGGVRGFANHTRVSQYRRIYHESIEVVSCVTFPPFSNSPTVCMHSSNGLRSNLISTGDSSPELDLSTEARLESEFVVSKYEGPRNGFATVLLTGSTGFLGVHLLRDLLVHTRAHVVCLVRAASTEAAFARVEATLSLYNLELNDEQRARIAPVLGDLGAPRLGWSEADYGVLAARVDTVFHSAAAVNFYQSYEQLQAVNVGGVREILRFAAHSRTKALHYVSSTGVFDSEAFQGVIVRETDNPAHCHGSVMGYTQTKWVAEQLVLQARNRGLPASVYRSPFIMGHSKSGVVDAENLVVKMLIGCVQGGAWPDQRTDLEMVAVNDLSRAIVHLAQNPAHDSHTFHLTSPQRMQWGDIGRAARSYGYPLDLPAYDEWTQRLAVFGRRKGNALRPLLRFYIKVTSRVGSPVPDIFARKPRPIFESAATQAALASAGLVPAIIDQAVFTTYLDFFVQQGWLPTPAEIQMNRSVVAPKSSDSRPPYHECAPRS